MPYGLLFRTFHLFYLKDVRTGVVWLSKILTDPFHDVTIGNIRDPSRLSERRFSDPRPLPQPCCLDSLLNS